MRTLGPREGLGFSRPSSLAAIGPVPRMYASRAAFGIAARRLAECAERVPAHARIAVLVVSDDTRTPPFVSEAIGLRVLSGRGIAGAVERGQSRKSLSVPRSRLKSCPEWGPLSDRDTTSQVRTSRTFRYFWPYRGEPSRGITRTSPRKALRGKGEHVEALVIASPSQ
jgi:hypothetical protein